MACVESGGKLVHVQYPQSLTYLLEDFWVEHSLPEVWMVMTVGLQECASLWSGVEWSWPDRRAKLSLEAQCGQVSATLMTDESSNCEFQHTDVQMVFFGQS